MKKRCDVCGLRVSHRFAYDGLNLCSKCKGNVRSCDNYKAKSVEVVKPAVSRAQYESQRMQAAKAAREAKQS